MAIFKKTSPNFHFKSQPGIDRDTVIYAKIDCIFSLNFLTEEVNVLYKFNEKFIF